MLYLELIKSLKLQTKALLDVKVKRQRKWLRRSKNTLMGDKEWINSAIKWTVKRMMLSNKLIIMLMNWMEVINQLSLMIWNPNRKARRKKNSWNRWIKRLRGLRKMLLRILKKKLLRTIQDQLRTKWKPLLRMQLMNKSNHQHQHLSQVLQPLMPKSQLKLMAYLRRLTTRRRQ